MFNVGYWQDYALLADSAHCNLNQYLSYIDGLLDTLEVDLRSGTTPGEYAATQWVELQPGFESGLSDNYVIYISDYDSAAGNIVACINPAPVADTVSIVTLDPPCEKAMTMAVSLGQELYRLRTEQLLADFETAYRAAFAAAADQEQFAVRYRNSEYHYTLYYYDQAGNLAKTVPPKGVNPDFTESFLDDVAEARAEEEFLPRPHTLVTEYRYNSLNQVVEQLSPDGGRSRFWYDRLGRLVVSQNAQQQIDGKYSYTRYDALGRIVEVGQKPHTEAMSAEISRDDVALNNWITTTGSDREQITTTGYDQPWGYELYPQGLLADSALLYQRHLRNRVSWTMIKETEDATDHIASFYTYDIHGNVDTLVQDFKALTAMRETGNRFKRITYRYDLISGKVNGVDYQPGQADAYYHRYQYDAENRLVAVRTSRDSVYWEQDAEYSYHKHGPLARTQIGKLNVQGLDYAYTLQGWLKGVNSTSVDDGAHDMGLDGFTGAGGNTAVARDVFGFALHYYDDGASEEDYVPLGGTSAFARPNNGNLRSLYNGNIAAMSVNNAALARASSGVNAAPLFYNYGYDQLNRLLRMRTFKGLSNSANTWSPVAINDYQEDVVYDPNGNILNYRRNGAPEAGAPEAMDDLTYEYYSSKNQLKRVTDAVSAGNYTEDIDSQTETENYVYDAIGNLVEDKSEGLEISWNVYGKISQIEKSAGTIVYRYDAAGNRVAKSYDGKTTIYVRDASGNVLSVYEKEDEEAISLAEVHLYGSTRLGMVTQRSSTDSLNISLSGGFETAKELTFTRAEKIFELSNHLGNVLVTVSDRRLSVDDGVGAVAYYEADVVTANDYYPFGMGVVGRKYAADGSYRYGFNGQERSKEIDANGNSMTAEFWQYDARLARRWNLDPKPNVAFSRYSCYAANPIAMYDALGDTMINGQKMEGVNFASATTLAEVTVKSRRKDYVPEQDFMHNPLTGYNSESGSNSITRADATVEKLALEFVQNWQCNDGSCRNSLIVGGELLEDVKDLESVNRLFIQGGNVLKANGMKPSTIFTGHYRMSDLNGKDGEKMKGQVLEDVILDKKPFTDSRFFSAEFFLGSYGFSMRVTKDGKYIAVTVYDSKTIRSLTDNNKSILSNLNPIDPATLPTYQRYFWAIPIEDFEKRYSEAVNRLYFRNY